MHSIPQSAEIEAREKGLQEKNAYKSFRVGPTNWNNTYDEVQELVTRQSYSGHIFVTVNFQGIVL